MKSVFVFRRALFIAALGVSVPFATACGSSESSGTEAPNIIEVLTLSIAPSGTQTIEIGDKQEYTLELEVRVSGKTQSYTTDQLAKLADAVSDRDLTQAEADAIEEAVESLVWSSSDTKVASIAADSDGSSATATGRGEGDADISVSFPDDAGAIMDSVSLKVEEEDDSNNKPDSGFGGSGADEDAGAGGSGGVGAGEDAGAGGAGGAGGSGGGPLVGDPGVTVDAPADGLSTSEQGASDTFTLVLKSEPAADVTVTVDVAGDEAVAAPTTLSFTATDWAAPQTVTVTGEDDTEADGDQDFTVSLTLASQDTAYEGLAVDGVNGVNIDDESSSILVSPVSGLETTEAGGSATFTVVLSKAPTETVLVPLSTDSDEVELSVDSLTFTIENFNAPQTVTVTGLDDTDVDGDQDFSIAVGPATSDDSSYNGEEGDNVLGSNLDDEQAGVVLSDNADLVTNEDSAQAAFGLNLLSQPAADVVITLSSSDEGEGTVSPASVTFTPENFNAPQTITVTGADDDVKDGDQQYTIVAAAESTDPAYSGLAIDDVSVINSDNDTAGFAVAPAAVVADEDGATAEVTVRLRTQPTADVTIPITSSDEGEATVSPPTLTFTQENWNSTKTVIVTGVDDLVDDGDQPFTVVLGPALSTDANYGDVDPSDVPGVNEDNDSPGLAISSADPLVVSEDGTVSDSFTVALDTVPMADVVVSVAVSDATEATLSVTELTFTPGNWNGLQTVDVNGVDDAVADGAQPFTVTVAVQSSDDPGYAALGAEVLPGSNLDVGDTAGILVEAADGLTTFEAPNNPSATFTVRLTSEPSALVTIPLSVIGDEGTVSPTSLTFTGGDGGNWDSPRTVTVTGVDDALIDGDQQYSVSLDPAVSTAAEYDGMDGDNVTLTNVDDDSAGVSIFKPLGALSTTEEGGTTSYQVSLTSRPTANVTVTLVVNDVSDCEINGALGAPEGCQPEVAFNVVGQPSELVVEFSPEDWDSRKEVPLVGQDDDLFDGQQSARVTFVDVMSTDPNYNAIAGPSLRAVEVVNEDRGESPGAFPTNISNCEFDGGFECTTTEPAGTASFGLRLSSQPTSNVVVNLAKGTELNEDEFALSTTSLTFTPSNWNSPQPVTLTGQNDDQQDGSKDYGVTLSYASNDTNYNEGGSGFVASIDGSNLDDDTAAIQVGEYVVGGTLTPFADDPAFELSEGSLPGGLFGVRLSTEPEDGNVMIDVTSADESEYLLELLPCEQQENGGVLLVSLLGSQKLTFTDSNWDTIQCLRAVPQNDDKQDGDKTVKITASVDSMSADDVYTSQVGAEELNLVNLDDDSADVILELADAGDCTGSANSTSSEAGDALAACVRVRLATNPTATVTVRLDLDHLTAATGREEASFIGQAQTPTGNVNTANEKFIDFTVDGNWQAGELVSIYGIDDEFADGDQDYKVKVGQVTGGTATDYGTTPQPAAFFDDLDLKNLDDDFAGITSCIVIEGCDTTIAIGEAGESQLVEVRLNTDPDPSVTFTVTLTGDGADRALLSLTEGGAGTNSLENITVTAADTLEDESHGFVFYVVGDNADIDNGDGAITVTITPSATSADDAYQTLGPIVLSGTVTYNVMSLTLPLTQ